MAKVAHKRFKTPYKNRVAKPTKAKKDDIAAQLQREGQRLPIFVDDEGNVLDGHTRYDILGDAVKFEVKDGFRSEAEKLAFVDYCDGGDSKSRTPGDEKDRQKRMRENAKVLRSEGRTQAEIAEMNHVCQATVSNWFRKDIKGNNASRSGGSGGASKESEERRSKVVELLKAGLSAAEVAKQTGLSAGYVAAIRKQEGIEPPKKGLTEKQIKAIREGISSGWTNTRIAKEIGVALSTVSKYVNDLNLQRPKKKLGAVPKAISGRALYCRDLLASGRPRAAALEQCGLTDNKYRYAARVADSGNVALIQAMDAEVLPTHTAKTLIGATDTEIAAAIEKAQTKQRKAATADGKQQKKPEQLLRLLSRTIDDWGGFQKNTLAKGGWIPTKGENAEKIRHQVTVVAQIVKEVVGVIQAKQGEPDGDG